MTRALSRLLLRLWGWRVRFDGLPEPKGVLIVYPHTSNWDFVIGLLAKWSIGLPLVWIGKESLFRGWTGATLGRVLRRWGGRPVDRHRPSGAVAELVALVQRESPCWIALSPEGTRRHLPHLRSGFYHLARALDLPVGLGFIDFGRREVGVVRFVRMSGDAGADLALLQEYYADKVARRPQLASRFAFREPVA